MAYTRERGVYYDPLTEKFWGSRLIEDLLALRDKDGRPLYFENDEAGRDAWFARLERVPDMPMPR